MNKSLHLKIVCVFSFDQICLDVKGENRWTVGPTAFPLSTNHVLGRFHSQTTDEINPVYGVQ